MTYQAQKAVKAKYNRWKRYTRSKQHYDFEDFKRKRNQATKEVRRARITFENKLVRRYRIFRDRTNQLDIYNEHTIGLQKV